jgi:hypothetical protein
MVICLSDLLQANSIIIVIIVSNNITRYYVNDQWVPYLGYSI